MRRNELVANLFFAGGGFSLVALLVAFLTTWVALAPGPYIVLMFFLWIVGFLLFLKAKISMIKQGKLLSFGFAEMSRSDRIFYVFGYIIMGIGMLLSLILIGFYR